MLKLQLGCLEMDSGDGSPIVVLDLDKLVPINEARLSDEMSHQASAYAYVAMQHSMAESEAQAAKRTMEEQEALADARVRAAADVSGIKATESMVSNRVRLDPSYVVTKTDYLDASAKASMLRALEHAMAMRAEMLISLGAHLRAEANATGTSINDIKSMVGNVRKRAN